MAIPDFQSLMLPALQHIASCKTEIRVLDLSRALAAKFALTEDELRRQLPSGRAPMFYNRVQWAVFHMRKAGLLNTPKRAHVVATERGHELLLRNVDRIDLRLLGEFPEFRTFRAGSTEPQDALARASHDRTETETPAEAMEHNFHSLRTALATDLLDRVKAATPDFFEQLVVELLVKMGYGGSRSDAGEALGRSGDEGIDGIIKEDRLGLDAIYIQAKRWKDKPVGRPDIQQFAGALSGQGAHKGIFLTTSRFTDDAREFIKRISTKIVLVDGELLANLMIDHGIGVSTETTYEIKRIDSDYFSDTEI
ncbi:MAG: restriction endonuclease [Planctomycetes bacterium]|nr:restriction endonuclease [Planctomycetota bacterium]